MTLQQKRVAFTKLLPGLIMYGFTVGYDVAIDQVKRTQAEALANAAKGIGIKNSLHLLGLAVDLILYDKSGNYLTDAGPYEKLGVWWEQQSTKDFTCCWGGRFQSRDLDHYSIEHMGTK